MRYLVETRSRLIAAESFASRSRLLRVSKYLQKVSTESKDRTRMTHVKESYSASRSSFQPWRRSPRSLTRGHPSCSSASTGAGRAKTSLNISECLASICRATRVRREPMDALCRTHRAVDAKEGVLNVKDNRAVVVPVLLVMLWGNCGGVSLHLRVLKTLTLARAGLDGGHVVVMVGTKAPLNPGHRSAAMQVTWGDVHLGLRGAYPRLAPDHHCLSALANFRGTDHPFL